MAQEADRLVIEVSFEVAEVACRIMEGLLGCHRPEGMTAKEALQSVGLEEGELEDIHRAAVRVMEYVTGCLSKSLSAAGQRVVLDVPDKVMN